MRVLAVTHGANVGAGVFGEAVRAGGHELDTWCVPLGGRTGAAADAVLVFGGAMHPDQDEQHAWLRDEHDSSAGTSSGHSASRRLPRRAADRQGGRARVRRARAPRSVGSPSSDSGGRPGARRRCHAASTRSSGTTTPTTLPAGGDELARSDVATQAFRLGCAIGIQFHAEVTAAQVESWLVEDPADVADPSSSGARPEHIGAGTTRPRALPPLLEAV